MGYTLINTLEKTIGQKDTGHAFPKPHYKTSLTYTFYTFHYNSFKDIICKAKQMYNIAGGEERDE